MTTARAKHWDIELHPKSYPVGSAHLYDGHPAPPNAANGAEGCEEKRGSDENAHTCHIAAIQRLLRPPPPYLAPARTAMKSSRANYWSIVLHYMSYPVGSDHPNGGNAAPPNAGGASGEKEKRVIAATAHRPFKCNLCGRCYARASDLDKHISAVHEKNRPWVCNVPDCGKSFRHRSSLNRHGKHIHKIGD